MKTIQDIREMVQDIKTCMMVTLGDSGQMRSRPMQVQEMDLLNQIWFFTSEFTSQAHDVANNMAVCLDFADIKGNRYLSLSGFGEVVHDKEKMKELYTPVMRAWFPEGLEDPRLTLLKVTPSSAEYWEAGGSRIGQMIDIAKAVVSGNTYKQGEHERVEM